VDQVEFNNFVWLLRTKDDMKEYHSVG